MLLGDPPLDWREVYSKGGDPKDADRRAAILDAMGGMTEHSDQLQEVAPH